MAQMADEFSISHRHGSRGTVVALRFPLQGQDQQIEELGAYGTDVDVTELE